MAAEPKTARLHSDGGWFVWACDVCVEASPGIAQRKERAAVLDGAYHNGKLHGDGRLSLVRGHHDDMLVNAVRCPEHGRVESVWLRGLVRPLPLLLTPAELTADPLSCSTCRQRVEVVFT